MSLEEIRQGQRVTYVPSHANGNASHPDAERGVVYYSSDNYVYVFFGSDPIAKACKPEQLIEG